MRLVLDTNVLVAAFRSDRGVSRQLLMAALSRRFAMLVSVPLMLEYEAVLTRPEQLRETGITADETNAVLDAVATVIEPVHLHFLWRPRLTDTADEMVLETAANGRADCLVTFNVRDFGRAASSLGVRVAAPGTVWREIEEHRHEKKQRFS